MGSQITTKFKMRLHVHYLHLNNNFWQQWQGLKAHQRQVELLNKTRELGNIDQENVYQFPRSSPCKTPLCSCTILRKFATECGAEKPQFLTSTCLRKHIAVVTQLLNLKDNELDIVAGFMGHDIRIHREYYRLPEDTLQLVKVSKFLINLEKGNRQHFKGKSLDDIDVVADGMCLCLLLDYPYVPIQN